MVKIQTQDDDEPEEEEEKDEWGRLQDKMQYVLGRLKDGSK